MTDDLAGAFRPLHVLTECPRSYVTEESRELLETAVLHLPYENALPYSGGVMEQPALLMDVLALVRAEMDAVRKTEDVDRALKAKGIKDTHRGEH